MRCFLAGLVLFLVPTVQAQDAKITGNWKFHAIQEGRPTLLFIVRITEMDNKLSGQLIPMQNIPKGFIDEVKVEGNRVRIKMELLDGEKRAGLTFEGKLPGPGSKNIHGSLERFGDIFAAFLEPTTARNQFDIERELVEKSPNDPRISAAVLYLVEKASAEKIAATSVKSWVELALRSAESHGPRWHAEMSIRLLDALTQNDYVDLAASMAAKMEADLDAKTTFPTRVRFLERMETALTKGKKLDEAGKITAKIDALENQEYADHHKGEDTIPVKKFAGRKANSNRAVMVELFTGAQCPPCVAADLAFDALEKTYQPTEVVLLQYHLHIPGPDALSNAASEARYRYYKDAKGCPSILFNGKIEAPGGGRRADAKNKYDEYRGVVDQLLEKPTQVRITGNAVRKGNKVQITANVRNIGKPGDNIRLRLALCEDWVRYKGANGMIYHHRVVRSMPGGAAGVPLPNAFLDTDMTVDIEDIRRDTHKYLDDFVRETGDEFPTPDRPMRMRQLHVVAFVQDDTTNEVLQALDIPVK